MMIEVPAGIGEAELALGGMNGVHAALARPGNASMTSHSNSIPSCVGMLRPSPWRIAPRCIDSAYTMLCPLLARRQAGQYAIRR
ncbi:hypothetical protein WG628_22275 [Stenotrophomonas maltophilia]